MRWKLPIELDIARSLKRIAIALFYAATSSCSLFAAAAAPQAKPSEYDVKAAYLLNFGKFVRFAGPPGEQPRTFDICILGRDPIGHAIDEIVDNESIDGRSVRVQRIPDPAVAGSCAILYVSADEGTHIREDLAVLGRAQVLTVSDAADFLDRGGMIQFVLQGDHVRFEINLAAVERANLTLSSELLRVAAVVRGKPGAQR